jgi:transposase InsO family protein
MQLHANAKLGPAGRRELVRRIEEGDSLRAAAAALKVAPATAHRWWHRWLGATGSERVSGRWSCDRPSCPRRSPQRTSAAEERRICAARRRTGWGPRLLSGVTGHPHATVSKVLRRHGLSRPRRAPREPARRYEWPCPGDLLHVDTKRYARFLRPGHAVTGDRTHTSAERLEAVGYQFCHAIVDDHSRLAYCELHADERAQTVTAFMARALAWFAAHGVAPRRLMSDNAWAYTRNRSLRELLAARGIKHLTTQAYRPRTNGKVERFHQTMAREWAYGITYATDRHRNRALPHWLAHYNNSRPHSALGRQPPISRVHNVHRQDI